MYALSYPLLIYYLVVIAVFCVYGMHRYWLLWLYRRAGGATREDPLPAGRFATLPRVTVQLPMFNERRVAERIISAACALDYPRDRLQVQVLDDSTDESARIAARCCERLAGQGHDVEYRHRDDRRGYKAGALAAGMATATGEYLALFDADFVPPPDWLRKTIEHFTDPAIGMVQTRWSHLNRDESLLTEIQAICLDGHFVIEQAARARSDRWFNFNGTSGMWRRTCIEEAGGWQHDTLTEDTDLSYRAQLAGWSFRYLPGVECPAELPPTVSALMGQQHRWNKGLIQTAIKLLPTILASRAPLRRKIEACFHLTAPLPYAAMFLLTLMMAPAFVIGLPPTGISPALAVGLGTLCLGLGTLSACVFYVASQRAQGRPMLATILRLPALMAVGVGVSALNTKAIVEALCGVTSPFVRTPKYNGGETGDPDPAGARRRRVPIPRGSFELFMGGVMVVCLVAAFRHPFALVGIPFIVLFGAGYLAIGLPRVLREVRRAAPESTPQKLSAAAAD